MIKSTIFNIWLTDNCKVNISSNYEFNEELDIIFKETFTGLSIYKTSCKFVKKINYWYQPGPYFTIINGIDVRICKGDDILHEEIFDFGDNIKVDLKQQIHYDKNDTNSWAPFFEVFIQNTYESELVKLKEDDIVVDFGANIGMFSLYASKKSKMLYSVEPDPITYENLLKNTESIDNIITINKAIYSKGGEIEFIRNEVSGASSLFNNQNNSKKITIDTISFSDFINQYNIDRINYLKVDIEGAEFDLFENMDEDFLQNNIDKIFMEVHLIGNFKLDDILNKIKKYFDVNIEINGKDKYGVELHIISCINKLIK